VPWPLGVYCGPPEVYRGPPEVYRGPLYEEYGLEVSYYIY